LIFRRIFWEFSIYKESFVAVKEFVPLIALTMGDAAGVGPEIAARTAYERAAHERCSGPEGYRLVVVGQEAAFQGALAVVGARGVALRHVDDAELSEPEFVPGEILFRAVAGGIAARPGAPSAETGRLAGRAVEEAVRLARTGKVDAVTTCPLSKEWLQAGGHDFPGHTEMLAALCGGAEPVMLFVGKLRVALATIHLPLAEVGRALSRDSLLKTLVTLDGSLKRDLALPRPRIAVCGLNPHAGEAGIFGREETDIIAPAIEAARLQGIEASGPHPADSLFPRLAEGAYECALAMYHDQGLIPVKLMDWRGSVNVTLGLPIVRTSPDHGTAFDIAGRGVADHSSLLAALALAAAITRNRASRNRRAAR
jgi:4-hydroxythreonine-4-phosphate dehydrogenase